MLHFSNLQLHSSHNLSLPCRLKRCRECQKPYRKVVYNNNDILPSDGRCFNDVFVESCLNTSHKESCAMKYSTSCLNDTLVFLEKGEINPEFISLTSPQDSWKSQSMQWFNSPRSSSITATDVGDDDLSELLRLTWSDGETHEGDSISQV